MKYRHFGKLDWEVSALGFGTMRLPIIGANQAKINEPEAISLIRYAVDQGVNYVDSAYVYHDGKSEIVVGKALNSEYKGKAKIATKMPVFSVRCKDELDAIFQLQLERLNTDRIDFYLFHSLNKALWRKVQSLDMIKWAERQMAKGRLSHLGFSFHDELDVFKEIIDSYDGWTLAQIQYNYLDENYQAGKAGLKYAASKGLAVVVMEPLSGGILAVTPPARIQKEWKKFDVKRTPADWALQWVWNQPEVSVALSGMNSMKQVAENIQSANHSAPNSLSEKQIALLAKISELYHKVGYIGCTKCRYCSHCPQNIDIPVTLAFLNEYSTKKGNPKAIAQLKKKYADFVSQRNRASNCIHCGQCEAICPQHLPVRKLLMEVADCLE